MSSFEYQTRAGFLLKQAVNLVLPKPPIAKLIRHIEKEQAASSENAQVSLLDIGFGFGLHWGGGSIKVPDRLHIVAMDAIEADVTWPAKERLVGFAPHDLLGIPSKSFDYVIAFDVIEHLSRESGYLLLYEMERIARFSSAVFTPNGHVWQPPAPSNPYQAHVSGWTPRDLRQFGWDKVFGARGLKAFYGPFARARFLPNSRLAASLRAVIDRFAVLFPSLSFSFIAVQTVFAKTRKLAAELDSERTG